MKYVGKHSSFMRFAPLIYLITFISINMVQKQVAADDPAQRWFSLAYLVLFAVLLLFLTYDWNEMRRFHKNKGSSAEPSVRRKQMITYFFAFVLGAIAVIINLISFLKY
ncbi:MAG: hypothetical protein E7L17_10160 [Clostridium sp.]|uniref:hypothetical protein n=1 Tax=Clostridium sp. TaxID=1506 RepID=UPI0029064A72|nr:hypothetical protein [Clostridium sp.]MDU7338463.1 hypothetical protein [Clostridium sp.]